MKKNIEISNGVKQKKKIFVGKILGVLASFLLAPAFASAETWNYTALGDSLAYGYGATGNYGYVDTYKNYVESDNGVTINLWNLGSSGWTSSDLLAALKSNAVFRAAVSSSRVITVDIGGNDLLQATVKYKAGICGGKKNDKCMKTANKNLKKNFKKILKEIKKLRGKQQTIYRTMNLYYSAVTSDSSVDSFSGDKYSSDFAFLNYYVKKADSILCKAGRSKGFLCADVHTSFNGASKTEDPQQKGYICADGLHPNDTGYQVIANDFRALGYSTSK
ncbi:MAG: GDSL-type esterase/lipase family protein [Patescibacteria group bacterium]|nr:GDSL-type esterase/lipase family protein [Patescibacteria group bacterium]